MIPPAPVPPAPAAGPPFDGNRGAASPTEGARPAAAGKLSPFEARLAEIERLEGESNRAAERLLELRQEIAAMESERVFADAAGERGLAEARFEVEALEGRLANLTARLEALRGGKRGAADAWAEWSEYLADRKLFVIPAVVLGFAISVFWWLSSQPRATDEERVKVRGALGLNVIERLGGDKFTGHMEYQEMISRELGVPEKGLDDGSGEEGEEESGPLPGPKKVKPRRTPPPRVAR